MSRVYLLLRNNKQTGPHSLEELLKLGFKPHDLIWVEGKSFGWSYPSEISTLKPYVTAATPEPSLEENNTILTTNSPATNQAYMPPVKPVPVYSEPAPARKIHVSMPAKLNAPVTMARPAETADVPVDAPDQDAAKKLEQKAEELRKRIQAYSPADAAGEATIANDPEAAKKLEQKAEELRKKIQAYSTENKPADAPKEEIVTKFSSTLEDRAGEYSSWIYNQKTKKAKQKGKRTVLIAIATLLILALGYGILQYPFHKKDDLVVAPAAISDVDKTDIQPAADNAENLPKEPVEQENTAKATTKAVSDNTTIIPVSEPERKSAKKTTPVLTPAVREVNKLNTLKDTHKNSVPTKNQGKETVAKVAPTVVPNKPESKTTVKNETEKKPVVAQQKKKTLNEKVDAFFGKFSRKKEEALPAEAPPTTTAGTYPGTKERKAVHRDDKLPSTPPPVTSKPEENTNLADFVEVTTNKPSDDWMLGVHGLKVTVRNASKETVKKAEVELRYYTEQNEVLDKKIVNFNNIPPGKTITLPAPDHRLADHADFRLVAVK